jgi:hypothetical protein
LMIIYLFIYFCNKRTLYSIEHPTQQSITLRPNYIQRA